MARRKRSTRRGGVRKTARRAYTGLKRRRTRYYAAARRTGRRAKSGGMALMKGKGGEAIKDCSLIVAGDAIGLVAGKQWPKVMGFKTSTALGVGALAWGIMKNRPEPIYLGFGALIPAIHNQMLGVLAKV